ncbi:hypothetical protein RBU60_10255 [Mesonia sp. MT50]|uniref:Uncharacterized protein n=1 Tax=Mesonia profundi TaxID=3070998 RepID=A0ABU1A2M5_9FLAO|nr:hypothetical protein [Mesonia profundi]MDQ7917958.1 hypothetical protein [Mesonia profundi]
MKYFIYFLMISAFVLLGYNATLLNLDDLFAKDSSIALAGILACLCVIVLMLILLMSRAIKEKYESE